MATRDDIVLNEQYKDAFWQFFVPMKTRRPQYRLNVPCYHLQGKAGIMHTTLAVIKLKNDRRWEYTLKGRPKDFTFKAFNDGKAGQGVVHSLEAAIEKVIAAVPEDYRANIPTDYTKARGYREYQAN